MHFLWNMDRDLRIFHRKEMPLKKCRTVHLQDHNHSLTPALLEQILLVMITTRYYASPWGKRVCENFKMTEQRIIWKWIMENRSKKKIRRIITGSHYTSFLTVPIFRKENFDFFLLLLLNWNEWSHPVHIVLFHWMRSTHTRCVWQIRDTWHSIL